MLTVHILTKNNAKTIQKTLDSVQWADRIMVADLGSTDETTQICEQFAEVYKMDCFRNEARNKLIEMTSGPTFSIEPWEAVAQGHQTLNQISQRTYVTILQNKTLTKEVRCWCDKPKFINPAYEMIEGGGVESNVLIYFTGRTDQEELLRTLQHWKAECPTAIAPYYYEACTLLSIGRWREFLAVSEHYMFLDKTKSISAVMNHYYFSMVHLLYLKKVVPTLQNLAICLAAKPLMAEFWCLAGDVHYHLTKKFNTAMDLYENAILLGSKRLKSDPWPMDLTKYKSYPKKMIESCEKIMDSKSLYLRNNQ